MPRRPVRKVFVPKSKYREKIKQANNVSGDGDDSYCGNVLETSPLIVKEVKDGDTTSSPSTLSTTPQVSEEHPHCGIVLDLCEESLPHQPNDGDININNGPPITTLEVLEEHPYCDNVLDLCEESLPQQPIDGDITDGDNTTDTVILPDSPLHFTSPQVFEDHSYCGIVLGTIEKPLPQQCNEREIDGDNATETIVFHDSPGSSEPTNTPFQHTDVFKEAAVLLRERLPPLWIPVYHEGSLNILKLSPSSALITQRSFKINEDGQVHFYVHGKLISEDHELHISCNKVKILVVDAKSVADSVIKITSEYRLYDICCGVPQEKFRKFWKSTKNCHVDSNTFQELRFNETCRSNTCTLLITQTKRMCKQCVQLSKNLSQRFKKNDVPPDAERITPSKFKPYGSLITPEKKARDHRKAVRIQNLRKANARLRARLDALIESEGAEVGETTEEELKIILNSAVSHPKTTPMQRIFMEQQLKACTLKDRRSMKWHPLLIRLALRIRMISSSAYNELRESGFIEMPSERTLYDYSHVFNVTDGVCKPIISDVAEVVDSFEHDYQRYHVLMFDEVYISDKIVQNKATGDVVGYCKLSEVQQEFEEFERLTRATAEGLQVDEPKAPPVAKRILSYLLKGTASSVSSVVASYPVNGLTKEDLMEYTWEVIEALETKDLRVAALIADGSAVNRAFFDMHPAAEDGEWDDYDEDGETVNLEPPDIVYCTTNIYAPDRNIYFFSDLPHLVKTARNCLYNSGKKNCRNLFKNGEHLSWATIVRLYNDKKDETLKKLHKLDAACVYLNSYTRMKCLYAFRVFSGSVSNAILMKNWPGTKELGVFGKV